MNKMDKLRWIRIFTPDHIPKYLIEQIKQRDYPVEDFYKYHRCNCLIENQQLNPFLHLYVLADDDNQVKGMLWVDIDPLTKDILIQTYSIDKDYWCNGEAVKKLADHVKSIREKGKLNKIYWVTTYPKHSERNGFKRSRNVLMEYNGEKEEKENGEDILKGEDKAHRECESSHSRAKLVPVERTRATAKTASVASV